MPMPSHQTVRLARGRHRSPDEGACVMELVSMLGGEPFGDHPATACPVIGTFLRSYNDLVSDAQRQDLLACASRVVGSRRPEAEAARIERCHELALEICRSRPAWWRGLTRALRWPPVAPRTAPSPLDIRGRNRLCWQLAVLLRSEPDGRQRALKLVEELVAIGEPGPVATGRRLPVPAA